MKPTKRKNKKVKTTPQNYSGILGYVELSEDKKVSIKPMDDHFINYTFDDAENWPSLKTIANIIYDNYKKENPKTSVTLIEGDIEVKTQLAHFQTKPGSPPRKQDIDIESEKKHDLIEMQIETKYLRESIEQRSIIYLGLSITRGGSDKPIQQLWLLADDLENKDVLGGKACANFTLMDELDHRPHTRPTLFAVMYVDLKELAKGKTRAAELANVLLGNIPANEINDKDVKSVFETLSSSFEKFREDKEVKKMLSYVEEKIYIAEQEAMQRGMQRGMQQGMQQGIVQTETRIAMNMLNNKRSVVEIAKDLGISVEQVERIRLSSLNDGQL